MQKYLMKVISYTFIPGCILGHYYTQHNAFIYLLGLGFAISIIVYLLALIGVGIAFETLESSPSPSTKANWEKAKLPPVWSASFLFAWGVTIIYWAWALMYLLYVQAFVTSTLLIIAIVTGVTFVTSIRSRYTKLIKKYQ